MSDAAALHGAENDGTENDGTENDGSEEDEAAEDGGPGDADADGAWISGRVVAPDGDNSTGWISEDEAPGRAGRADLGSGDPGTGARFDTGWYEAPSPAAGSAAYDPRPVGDLSNEPWMVDPEPGPDAGDESTVIHTPVVFATPDEVLDTGERGVLAAVSIDAIEPNEFQPRARFVDSELEALATSIEELGVLQPVLLRRIDVDRYELIAGERRWRAARRAGLQEIPAILRTADDQASLEQAVVENLHRADLNALEEAAAYRQLVEDFGMTQERVARRVGKSRSAVANLLRLFQLPSAVQRLIASDELGAGHARALLAFPDPAFQEELAARAVREGLSVRKVEELVRAASQRSAEAGSEGPERARGGTKPAAVLAVEELLADHLATNVVVTTAGERGRIVVEFADLDDLDRIAEVVLGDGEPDAARHG